MDLKTLKDFLGSDWKQTQDCISRMLNSDISLLNTTNAAILEASGKQMRPMLSLLIGRACMAGKEGFAGTLSHDSWHFAAACELLHNATLLHDDVADQSDERRGHPTLYSQMGASVSVLVGDYWLVKAVDCILSAEHDNSEVIRIFAKTLSNLAEGEMFQLQKAWSGDTSEEDYFRIIYNKTATLFEVTARCAVIAVGGDRELQEKMADFSKAIGLAFQIRDDIFDYSEGMNIGKPTGADILEKKVTLPLLGAFANAGAREEARIRKMISNVDLHPEHRDEIVRFVRENGGIEYARKRMDEMLDGALKDLDALAPSTEKEYLVALARYVGDRTI